MASHESPRRNFASDPRQYASLLYNAGNNFLKPTVNKSNPILSNY